MILGVGNDVIEIERIKNACEKQAFLSRCYTLNEIMAFQNSPTRLAGNFAVKEAVSKVFGTGFSGFGPIDIEVLRDELGRPFVILYNGANNKAREMGITKLHVTITNTKTKCWAVAIGEGE